MSVDQLLEQIEGLPQADRENLLARMISGRTTQLRGVPLSELQGFFGSIDDGSAHEMIAAIEEGCEQVDEEGW